MRSVRHHVLALVLLVGLLLTVITVRAQTDSRSSRILFDAVTLDDSRVELTPTQARQVAKISRLARHGRQDAACKEWGSFVSRYGRSGSVSEFEAIELMVVRDAFFNDRELLEIGRGYRQSIATGIRPQSAALDAIDSDATGRRLESLREQQAKTSANSEMTMMKLQAAMQSRSQTLQVASGFLVTIDDTRKTIVGNLR